MTTLLDFLPDDNDDQAKGERLRDQAFQHLQMHRPLLIRRIQREFLQHLLEHGADTSDAVRAQVEIPPGVDPRLVGAAVGRLSTAKLIVSVGRAKSRRPEAHARTLDRWSVADEMRARHWLLAHPEPEPTADPDDPFAL